MPGASEQLLQICAGAKSRDRQEGCHLIRSQQAPAAICLRLDLDRVQGRPRQSRNQYRAAQRLRPSHDVAERDRRTYSSPGDSGDPNDRRGARTMDAGAVLLHR